MEVIHTLSSGFTIDLSKIQIVTGINNNNEFSILLDYDGSITFHGNNTEGVDIATLYTELLQAWKDYSAPHKT